MTARILAQGLGVRFSLDRQRRPVTPIAARIRRRCTTHWGLTDVDLAVGPGEGVALLGANGAGKTTLLRAFAGVLVPDAGRLEVAGRLAPTLSTDAGLLPRLTGRESAMLLGVLGGLSRAEARRALDTVRVRIGLGAAFERPVSTYSQGMRARLGVAVMEQTPADIVVLDEVHEALDEEFHEALAAHAELIRRRGGIVVAAGHDQVGLGRMCRRAVLMAGGRVVDDGPFAEVAGRAHHAPALSPGAPRRAVGTGPGRA